MKLDRLYDGQVAEMEKLCLKNGLEFSFESCFYPITFTIREAPEAVEQSSLFPVANGSANLNHSAYIQWTYMGGELEMRIGGGEVVISKTLRQKIESILIKMIALRLESFFFMNSTAEATA